MTEPSFIDDDPASSNCTGVLRCSWLSVSVQVAVVPLSLIGDEALHAMSRPIAAVVRRNAADRHC